MSDKNKRRTAHECAGKLRYSVEQEAISRAVILGLQYKKKLVHYKCRQCHGFHVGNEKKGPPVQESSTVEIVNPDIHEKVEEAMEAVRDNHYLTTEVSQRDSIHFLVLLSERLGDLAAEIGGEIVKAERRAAAEKLTHRLPLNIISNKKMK